MRNADLSSRATLLWTLLHHTYVMFISHMWISANSKNVELIASIGMGQVQTLEMLVIRAVSRFASSWIVGLFA